MEAIEWKRLSHEELVAITDGAHDEVERRAEEYQKLLAPRVAGPGLEPTPRRGRPPKDAAEFPRSRAEQFAETNGSSQ